MLLLATLQYKFCTRCAPEIVLPSQNENKFTFTICTEQVNQQRIKSKLNQRNYWCVYFSTSVTSEI